MEWINNLLIKLQALKAIHSVRKMPRIEKLTLWHMILEPERYAGIASGLAEMPLPDTIRIKGRDYTVPQTLEEFSTNICYAQRLFFATPEEFDVGIILRYVAGYYYPFVNKDKWDEKKVLMFYKKIISLRAINLYPVAIQLLKLMGELAERERTLLNRQPSAQEVAANIERLNKFSSLTALLFLQDSFKATESEVMLKPYDDCLARFLLAKEQNAFTERLQEVYKQQQKPVHGKR